CATLILQDALPILRGSVRAEAYLGWKKCGGDVPPGDPLPERRAWGPLLFALVSSETKRSAADEDEDAQADQDDGEQDVFPAFEDFGDRRAGGDEPGEYDQDRDEREEDEAVSDHCEGLHAQEDGDIDTDVVSAVGEGASCDSPRADLLARDLGVIVVIASAPGLPCGPEPER